MKRCSKCGVGKSVEGFNKDKSRSDGYSSNCSECNRAKCRKHRAKNLEAIRAYDRERYKGRREECSARGKAHYRANLEHYKQRGAEYRLENLERLREYDRQRYIDDPTRKALGRAGSLRYLARKRGAATESFTAKQLTDWMSMFGNKCVYCGGPFEHVDHLVPLSRGGAHCLANLRPSCAACNASKGAKPYREWLAERD